ncbi:MAG TPA: LapA family protein [Actinomycetota bacterium]
MDEREAPRPPDDPRREREISEVEQEQMQRLARERRARLAKTIVILAIAIILIVFVTQNLGEVPIDFVFVTESFPLIWVLIVTTLLGAVAGYLLGRPSKAGRREPDER